MSHNQVPTGASLQLRGEAFLAFVAQHATCGADPLRFTVLARTPLSLAVLCLVCDASLATPLGAHDFADEDTP